MEQILYLGHQTNLNNLEKILESDYIYTSYERKKFNIKYEGLLSMTNNTNFENKEIPIKHFKGEFPGVYMNYYTKDTIDKKNFIPNILIVFGRELLEQNNYHINLYDHNGKIMENITFPKQNIDKLPNIKDVLDFYDKNDVVSYFNEIVFHDKISIQLITKIWCNSKETYDKIKEFITSNKKIKNKNELLDLLEIHYKLPKQNIHIPKPALSYLDMKSIPYYVFYFDNTYTGEKIPYYPYKTKYFSSLTFCKNIARIANVPDDVLKNIHDIPTLTKYMEKHKLFDYYFHIRHEQNKDVIKKLFS
jgi:hypothetical protein